MSASTLQNKPQTISQKLLSSASGRDYVDVGEIIYPVPDLVIIHDGFVEGAYRELSSLGYKSLCDASRVMFVTDHEVAYGSQQSVTRGKFIRDIAKRWHVGNFYDVGRGGHGHLFPIEKGLVKPGMFLFAYDMHCTTFGVVGALALGVGPEVTAVLATGTLWTQVPATIRIDLTGELAPGSHARDAGFLIAAGFASGKFGLDYDNCAIEFGDLGTGSLELHERVALLNSITEIGVATVIFETDEVYSDSGANYAGRLEFNLCEVKPQVALPGGPENADIIDNALGVEIQHAYLGSCGSGMYQDFVDAAELMRGKQIADHVRMVVVPGSVETAQRMASDGLAQVFMQAGAMLLPAGCGPCAGGLLAPLGPGEVSMSTAATNHRGRFGSPEGRPYLGSPLTVAASALAGRISDPREGVRYV